MTARWRKAIVDLWQERTRTAFVVLAITIGISSYFAILSAYAILTRELDKGYLNTNPASAILHTNTIDDALLSAVLADRDVSNAEARRVVYGKIRTGPVEWHDLRLFVVKDYANVHISKFVPEQGAWPPRTGEVLIERDAFHVAHAKIGDPVTIRLSDGKDQRLRISGRVHDVGLPQARMEITVYGYITLQTLVQLGEKPYWDQLDILVAKNSLDAQHVRAVAQRMKNVLVSRGHPVESIEVPRPGKHPHADLMGILLLAMSTFGLLVLLLSGILVVNLLMGMMASQARQIGVMRAIGGRRRQVALIYFGEALMLGMAALLLAFPVGIFGGRVLCTAFAALLNFDVTSFAVPLWVYLLVVAASLIVPLLAAAYPIWKGTAIPIREALVDAGTSQQGFGASIFDRMLAGIGGPSRPILLAVRNSFRRRARLALTLATLAAAGIFFMSAINIRSSMIRTLDRLFASMRYDLVVGFEGEYPKDHVERAIKNIKGIVRSETWFTAEGVLPAHHETGPYGGDTLEGERFSVRALPSRTGMINLQIVEGRNLRPGEVDGIIVNTALAAMSSEMRVGNTVAFRIGTVLSSWRVVGVARQFFTPPAAYVPQAFADRLHPDVGTTAYLALARTDPASVTALKGDLEQNLAREGVRVSGSTSKAEMRAGRDEHMLMIYLFLVVMSGIIMLVGGLGLATTMSINVMDRRREMGVLRAIGATSFTVWLIIVSESAVVGVLSWCLAALAAWPVSKVLGDALVRATFRTNLDFSFHPEGLLIWLGVSVLFSAAASFLPAWSASQITVREALAHE